MSESDPLKILLSHDRWATRLILEACKTLTSEQFHQRFEMGPGSLHDTISHMLAALRTWRQTLSGQAPGPRIDQDGQRRTPVELLALHEAICGELGAEAHRRPLDELVTRVRNGVSHQFTRGAVLTHMATHSMHHRAQCLNMMRRLGVKPLPPSSVAEWTRLADA